MCLEFVYFELSYLIIVYNAIKLFAGFHRFILKVQMVKCLLDVRVSFRFAENRDGGGSLQARQWFDQGEWSPT